VRSLYIREAIFANSSELQPALLELRSEPLRKLNLPIRNLQSSKKWGLDGREGISDGRPQIGEAHPRIDRIDDVSPLDLSINALAAALIDREIRHLQAPLLANRLLKNPLSLDGRAGVRVRPAEASLQRHAFVAFLFPLTPTLSHKGRGRTRETLFQQPAKLRTSVLLRGCSIYAMPEIQRLPLPILAHTQRPTRLRRAARHCEWR